MYTVGVLTVSDSASKGQREDKTGPFICEAMEQQSFNVLVHKIVPDDKAKIGNILREWCDKTAVDLILTTGGTGPSPTDVTPEATKAVIEKELPGIPEALRIKGMEFTPMAILSRACCGIRGKSLIINLPGSLSAVQQGLEIIMPVLKHLIAKIKGDMTRCGG